MVELAEEPDVRFLTNIFDVVTEDLRVGLEVEVFFEDWSAPSGRKDSGVWIPLFRPTAQARHHSSGKSQ
jgi:uncharacterized OB-fold protein